MKTKIKAIILALTLTIASVPFVGGLNVYGSVEEDLDFLSSTNYERDIEWDLYDDFIRYDLCVTDYDSLTDEEKELCEFIFETERSATGTVRCERARRILNGYDIGERLSVETITGKKGIIDPLLPSVNGEYNGYAIAVPDIIHLDGNSDFLYTKEYWLDDTGSKRILYDLNSECFGYAEYNIEITENTDVFYYDYYDDALELCYGEIAMEEGAPVETITSGGWTYVHLSDGTIAVTGDYVITEQEEFIIPSEIDGYSVSQIYGLFSFSEFTTVIFPDTLNYISDHSFSRVTIIDEAIIDCPKLTIQRRTFESLPINSVEINVKKIGEYAFNDCQELETVILHEGLELIEANSFYNCTAMSKIDLPSTVKVIEQGAFLNTGIDSIMIPETVKIIGAFPERYGIEVLSGVGNQPANDPLTEEPVCAFNSDCVINGYYNTEAHRYAVEWGLKFNPLDEGVAYGDINLDGEISVADAVLLQSKLVGKDVTVGYEADLAKDGIIDIFDMIEMRSKLISKN